MANGSAPSLKGVFAASSTAVRPDGQPDLEATLCHVRWLIANGCDGVAPLGTTGEANSFSVDQKLALIAALAEATPRERLLIGTGACALADAVRLTRAAVAAGSPHVLMLPPFYYKQVDVDGLYRFYAEVIERVGSAALRVYLYHFPQLAGVAISAPLIERLLTDFPGIVVGMKDSSGDLAHMLETCRRFPGFAVFSGTEAYLSEILGAGGAGCISATVNVTAPLARRAMDAWAQGGDVVPAQAALTAARLALQAYPLIPAIKAVIQRRTGKPAWGQLVPPHLPMAAATVDRLMDDLRAAGFFDAVGLPVAAQ